ncbi:MAG: ISNCY family transposase, partial [Nodosilinea sp.]
MVELFRQRLSSLPDKRTGKNNRYGMEDAALSAFSVFFTQTPSFLAYQRMMEGRKGKSNAQSLFGVHQIPSDNQIRNLLDPVSP